MKHRHLFIGAAAVLLTGCSGLKQPKAVEEREQWLLSLNDSIALYQKQSEEVTAALSELRGTIGDVIGDFDYISNPREVEGYHIFRGWKNRYPLSQTGVVARITEDERLELIATLAGGTFNELGVRANGETRTTGIVPHDQALNYRSSGLNKVCFTGEKADSALMLIAVSESPEISFIEGGKKKQFKLPTDQHDMLSATWRLYALQKQAHNYEKELPRLAGKVAACRRLLDRENTEGDSENTD